MRTAILGALVMLSCGSAVQAQFSSSGTFGNRTLGGGISQPNSFGAGSPGSSTGFTNGGSLGATSAFGQSSSMGGGSTTQGMQAGQVNSGARYLPENRQGAFVGADRGDASNPFSQQAGMMNQANTQQNAFFNQLNQQMRRNQQMQQQMQRQSQQQNGKNNKQVRVSMKIGFTNPAPVSNVVTQQMSTRLTKLPGLKAGPIAVSMDAGTAVLSGRVATEYDRELAEGLALMEPGVGAVRNELIVDPAVTTAPERAPVTVTTATAAEAGR